MTSRSTLSRTWEQILRRPARTDSLEILRIPSSSSGKRRVDHGRNHLCKIQQDEAGAFQIKTAILSEDGKRAVDKTALSPEGEAHIRSFEEKYRLLSEESGVLSYLKPELRDGGRTARFEFLTGVTLAERLKERISEIAQRGESGSEEDKQKKGCHLSRGGSASRRRLLPAGVYSAL